MDMKPGVVMPVEAAMLDTGGGAAHGGVVAPPLEGLPAGADRPK